MTGKSPSWCSAPDSPGRSPSRISRGYERGKIGVGGDEMHAVLRALILAIAAGAVPSAVTGRYGVVALCVMARPIAGAASLAVRFAARKNLHRQQRAGPATSAR